jgi:4-aminobutyrate aminotransferase-like enzyme
MGEILMDGLVNIQRDHQNIIGDVRGKGLMVGVELVVDETLKDRTPNPAAVDQVMEETKKRGLLIGRGGLYGNTLRIAPALNIGSDEVIEALAILKESFAVLD